MNDMTKKGATMGDEDLYLRATREADSEERDAALWAKVIVLADGNAEKARFQYIKLRVHQLENERVQPKAEEKPLPKPDAIVRRVRPVPPELASREELHDESAGLSGLKKPVVRLLVGVVLFGALILLMKLGADWIYSYREIQGWTSASNQGDARASAMLSKLYRLGGAGYAVATKDDNAALRWLKLAAAQGHLGATVQLGAMYEMCKKGPGSNGTKLSCSPSKTQRVACRRSVTGRLPLLLRVPILSNVFLS